MTVGELKELLAALPSDSEVVLKTNVQGMRFDPEFHTTEYLDSHRGKVLIVGDTLDEGEDIYKFEDLGEEENDAEND